MSLIHSVVPQELLDPGEPLPPRQCRAFRGGYLELSGDASNCTISRIISTDPALYLDPHLAPGQTIDPRTLE